MSLGIKYRPKTLHDIWGHEKVVEDLEKRSKEGSWSKVIMFTGLTGVGKTTLARIVAKNILCNDKDENGFGCNKCFICTSIDLEKPTNFYFEENGGDIKTERMREITISSKQKVMGHAKHKIFVIDELQELSRNPAAMKNLLKTLEAPSNNAYFILGAMHESKIPLALINRATPYRLQPLPYEVIASNLQEICIEEGIKDIDKKFDLLMLLATNSGQSMRTALTYLDRVIYANLWDPNEALKELNLVDNDALHMMLIKMFNGDASAIESISKVEKDNTKLNDRLVDAIREIFNIIYKGFAGLSLSDWQKNQVKNTGWQKLNLEIIRKMIDEINTLYFYPYQPPSLVEFIIINCVIIVQKNNKIISNKPIQKKSRRTIK